MKTRIITKTAFLILVAGLAFASCKKKESTTIESYENDTIQSTMDTVGPEVDSINMDTTAIRTDTIAK
ncbi:hypothetical protein D3C86_2151070 [compost metagenome]